MRRRAAGRSESHDPAPEKLVKTHCCFCGQQCGIQLKVRDNQVIGFEPWEEFPFNRGMLCPKGVKRYLQSRHPDRLLRPLMRTDGGFRPSDVGRGARIHRSPLDGDPGEIRKGLGGRLRRGLADHREGLPAGQVRARRARNPPHRLQRPALHGLGGNGLQAGVRRRSQPHSLERYPQGGRRSWSPARTSAIARQSPPTTSGAAATAAAS